METLAEMMGWTNFVLAWTWLTWLGLAVVIGGVLIVCDNWRFHRTRPTREDIGAYADQLEAMHGREAFRINGDAMYEARLGEDFDRYRFLKEVSGELVRRFFSEPAPE